MNKPQSLINAQNEIKAILSNRIDAAINSGLSVDKIKEATKRNLEWLKTQIVFDNVTMFDILTK